MPALNPDHPITTAREDRRVRVLFEGHEIADSGEVMLLREADYPIVRYFPRGDVAMAFLHKTEKVSWCPYKGQASYYTIVRDAKIIENAVWSYETPLDGMGEIAGRLAFYPEHVDFQVGGLTAAETRAADVDDIVRHTDSGSGSSQAEHWPSNVSMPDDEAWEGDDIDEASPEKRVDRPYEGTGSI